VCVCLSLSLSPSHTHTHTHTKPHTHTPSNLLPHTDTQAHKHLQTHIQIYRHTHIACIQEVFSLTKMTFTLVTLLDNISYKRSFLAKIPYLQIITKQHSLGHPSSTIHFSTVTSRHLLHMVLTCRS